MAEDVRKAASTQGMAEFEREYEVPRCVLLDSAYCSMGRMIAIRACKQSGWVYHDSMTLLELVPELNVTPEDVDAFEASLVRGAYNLAELRTSSAYQRLAQAFELAARCALEAGPCLIHDRVTKGFVQNLGYSCVSAFSYAHDVEAKRVRARVSPLYAKLTDPAELDAAIEFENGKRRAWHALGDESTRWGEPEAYDLMLNTDLIGRDFAAELLARLMLG